MQLTKWGFAAVISLSAIACVAQGAGGVTVPIASSQPASSGNGEPVLLDLHGVRLPEAAVGFRVFLSDGKPITLSTDSPNYVASVAKSHASVEGHPASYQVEVQDALAKMSSKRQLEGTKLSVVLQPVTASGKPLSDPMHVSEARLESPKHGQ